MGEFIFEYGIFLAKAVTVVASVGAILILIIGFSRRNPAEFGLTVEKLNDRYRDMTSVLQHAVLKKSAWKQYAKDEKKERKNQKKDGTGTDEQRRRLFVLDFKGDIRATGVKHLREEISAVVSVATAADEVVLRLENPGGTVHEHGLAASQLLRIKDSGIPLTVIVDKVAASGGYLMACIADRIIAAPFAVIGSIGSPGSDTEFQSGSGVTWSGLRADNGRQVQAYRDHVWQEQRRGSRQTQGRTGRSPPSVQRPCCKAAAEP